jgi:acyl phosphate:glycerol-3-phosphate acyltransferase
MSVPLGEFTSIWPFWAAAAFGYLLGSIPFGLVLTRLAGLGDVRAIGSGSIGATNVLRTGNKGLAALTVFLDGGKGAAAVFLGATYGPETALLAGAGAFIGHLFPFWLKFKGGKGFSTFLGVLLAANWPVGLLCCLTWLAVALLSRYSSLATMIAALAGPGYAYWLGNWQIMELAAFMTVLLFIRHHQNIRRLLTGAEPKIGAKN